MRCFFRPRLPVRSGGCALVEGDGVVEDAGPGREIRATREAGHVAAVLTGEAGSPVCALKEAVHALCPVFLLDVDQGPGVRAGDGRCRRRGAPPLRVK